MEAPDSYVCGVDPAVKPLPWWRRALAWRPRRRPSVREQVAKLLARQHEFEQQLSAVRVNSCLSCMREVAALKEQLGARAALRRPIEECLTQLYEYCVAHRDDIAKLQEATKNPGYLQFNLEKLQARVDEWTKATTADIARLHEEQVAIRSAIHSATERITIQERSIDGVRDRLGLQTAGRQTVDDCLTHLFDLCARHRDAIALLDEARRRDNCSILALQLNVNRKPKRPTKKKARRKR